MELKSYDEMNAEQRLAWQMGYARKWQEPPSETGIEAAAKAMHDASKGTWVAWENLVKKDKLPWLRRAATAVQAYQVAEYEAQHETIRRIVGSPT